MKKIVYTVLILVALALFINISDASATNSTNLTVTNFNPVNNGNATANTVINATFNEPVQIGNGSIALSNSSGSSINITNQINGNTLTVTPANPLKLGNYTLTLNNGSITDLTGNNLTLTTSQFTVVPPILTGVNGNINIITATFNEPIQMGSGWIVLTDHNGTSINITNQTNGSTLFITPTTLLTGGNYTLTLHTGSIKDLAGNNLALCSKQITLGLFTIDQVAAAAGTIESYVNFYHQLPANVSIAGSQVTMAQFLELEAQAIVNIYNNNLTLPLAVGNYKSPNGDYDNITEPGPCSWYLTLANSVVPFMNSNKQAPSYYSMNNNTYALGYSNVIYGFAQILNSYEENNKILPSFYDLVPWSVISNSSTVLFTTDQINTASDYIKNYIESNHRLPSNVSVAGTSVTMPQYLYMAIWVVEDDYNLLSTTIPLLNATTPINPSETLTSGTLTQLNDVCNIDNAIFTYMWNNHGLTPNNITTPLGNMRYESLIYMYAQLLDNYRLNKAQIIPTNITHNQLQLWGMANTTSHITVQPYSYVFNSVKPSFTINQIETAAAWVENYIIVNNALPGYVTISGVNIVMPQFLLLASNAIQNINGTVYTSRYWPETYNYPSDPYQETIDNQFISKEDFIKLARAVSSDMYSSNTAPNYETLSTGQNVGYQTLIFLFSEILNSHQSSGTLPLFTRIYPWDYNSNVQSFENVVDGPTWFFNINQIDNAASYVKTYIETNHQLPSTVQLKSTNVDMNNFLELEIGTFLNIVGNNPQSWVTLENYGGPYSNYDPNLITIPGNLSSQEYLNDSLQIQGFYDQYGRAPTDLPTSIGDLQFESQLYMYSELIDFYSKNSYFPASITVEPWTTTSSEPFFTLNQIETAAGTVQSETESNHQLPGSVRISNTNVDMGNFLHFECSALENIQGTLYTSFNLYGGYRTIGLPTDAETIYGPQIINSTVYLNISNNILNFMDTSSNFDGGIPIPPAYAETPYGHMSFESLVYIYAQLLNYYQINNQLPENITFTPWSTIESTSTKFYTLSQIESAAGNVQSNIESTHNLASNYTVTINGNNITMPQLLQLESQAITNINGNLYTSYILGSYSGPTNSTENITASGNLGQTDYINLANNITAYMTSNGQAPGNMTTTLGTLSYKSLIYIFSQILNSYKTRQILPDYITINPWNTVTNNSTKFINMSQIINASSNIQSYIQNNHTLPSTVTISGQSDSMPQYLQLATATVENIYGNLLNTSIILKNVGNATNTTENIISGYISYSDYVLMAENIQGIIASNGSAPGYAYNTGLGTYMGFPSLVNMYSEILKNYNINNATLPYSVSIIPWIALSNPNEIYDYQTQKNYTSVQSAIDDPATNSGDTIGLGIANITENIVVDKQVNIVPVPGLNVTVTAANSTSSVFELISSGSGSTIQGLNIKGATGYHGIYILNSTNNMVINNMITGNTNGICLYENATGNQILGNTLLNNTSNGIYDKLADNNTFSGNNVSSNPYGISVNTSNNIIISANNVANNSHYGINMYNNSTGIVNYNRIFGNGVYGLLNQGNGTVDATNNWWGHNTLNSSDVHLYGGIVNYTPYLLLNIKSSIDRTNTTGPNYNTIITADLTQNNQAQDTSNGNDSTPDSNIPDNIPINFTSTLGNMTTITYTRNGQAIAILNSKTAGNALITVRLDNQTLNTTVNIQSINTLPIQDTRSGNGFTSIQSAINDPSTLNGDTLTLASGTYTENVNLYKQLTIEPATGATVTIQPLDPTKNVFTIIPTGSGSTIENLKITGASDSVGVLTYYANDVNLINDEIVDNYAGALFYNSNYNLVTGNNFTNNWVGIMLYNSTNNTINGNNAITDNWYGIYLYGSNNNQISGANVTGNRDGIYLYGSNNAMIQGNIVNNNWNGIYLDYSSCASISNTIITSNMAGVAQYNSGEIVLYNDTLNNNIISDQPQIDTSGIVMATSLISCGPASLATVMNYYGVNVTQQQLAQIAGTNTQGTSMAGLAYAAQYYGFNATGMDLTADQLQPYDIVLLDINGNYHYAIIKSINGTTVYLMDTNLGNIQMNMTQFMSYFTGHTLIITCNGTTIQRNGTVIPTTQMQNLIGGDIVSWAEGGLTWLAKTVGNDLEGAPGAIAGDLESAGQTLEQDLGDGGGGGVIDDIVEVIQTYVPPVVVASATIIYQTSVSIISSIFSNPAVETAVVGVEEGGEVGSVFGPEGTIVGAGIGGLVVLQLKYGSPFKNYGENTLSKGQTGLLWSVPILQNLETNSATPNSEPPSTIFAYNALPSETLWEDTGYGAGNIQTDWVDRKMITNFKSGENNLNALKNENSGPDIPIDAFNAFMVISGGCIGTMLGMHEQITQTSPSGSLGLNMSASNSYTGNTTIIGPAK